MRNIGPVSRRWLSEVDVLNRNDLQQVGSIRAYRMVCALKGRNVSLNLLWALEGALLDIDCRHLSQKRKAELKQLL